ncbi:MAG: glutathione S-transferase family protein [Pseudomonadota bacterium]
MSTLTFYTHPMSRGRIARWMLEEVGQPYDTVVIDYGPRDPAFMALNPMGKVPALTHGEVVVTECAAICAYLADTFERPGLAPALDDPARGAYLRWMFFAAGPLEAAMVNEALGLRSDDERAPSILGYGTVEQVIDTLEGALDGVEYIVGDRFSAADVYLGSHVIWHLAQGTLPERPTFRAYADRLMARPAAIKAAQIDDELLKLHPFPGMEEMGS